MTYRLKEKVRGAICSVQPAPATNPQTRDSASARPCYNDSLRVSDSAAITPLARTQQRLPMVSSETAFGQRLTPVRRFFCRRFQTTRGIFGMAGSGG
jgi:hypothetical protein